MLSRLLSISYLAFIAVTSAVFYVVAVVLWIVTAPFDRRKVILHMVTSFWGSLYLWVMPAWSVTLEGRHHIRKGVPYVVVSNHQSGLDILVAFRLFFPFKWVSKAEAFRIPFIGWNMVLNGYIKLKRGDVVSVRRMLEDCEKALAKGNSIFISPEGTRSETGRVKRFKTGAFTLAKKMRAPILPIAISGASNALPKRSLRIRGKHFIRVNVLSEIPYDTFADTPADDLAEQVRQMIAAEVEGTEGL